MNFGLSQSLWHSTREEAKVENASGMLSPDTERSKNKNDNLDAHHHFFKDISESKQTMVLDIGQQDGPKPKCHFTPAPLPSYIDNARPPTKKEPFRTVLDQQYSHSVCQISLLRFMMSITKECRYLALTYSSRLVSTASIPRQNLVLGRWHS